jgi:hypothetical protein
MILSAINVATLSLPISVPLIFANDSGAFPPSFFSMTTVNENDYPKLTFGTLAHPEIGA